MATHWTYSEFDCGDDLAQGDILLPSRSLREIFQRVHPHFLDEKYLGFMVLTQTCDLVRRRGKPCKSKYVNLAVIRRLREVLPDLLRNVCREIAPGVFQKETKARAREFLSRLFNQNEQGQGLFYLHEDADVGLGEPAVTILQVNVALRSQEHYEVLATARNGRLSRDFQAKLGWLTGNLYSRVATPDWEQARIEAMIRGHLGTDLEGPGPKWVPKAWHDCARRKGIDLLAVSQEDLSSVLAKCRPPSPRDEVVSEAVKVLEELDPSQCDDLLRKFRNRLTNNPVISSFLDK